MKEFDKYITISFDYDGCNYNHKIDKKRLKSMKTIMSGSLILISENIILRRGVG